MPNFFDDTQQESVNFFDDTQDAEYKPEEVGGFFASAKQAVGATIKGAGQLAGDLPGIDDDNALKRYGRSVIDANPTIVHGFGDMADNKLSTVTEATGNAAGSIGGMLGARALGMGITAAAPLTGPFAPATAIIGQAVAWLGPMAIAALPSYGGIREKQIINDPTNNEDWKSKAVAAMGAATVGAIETKFGPQNWALGAMTKEGRAALAKKFAQTTLAKGVGFGIVKGGAIEGAEELVQNPVEQVASYDDPTTAKSLEETAFGGAMGAIGGGVLGGGVGGVAYGMRTQAQPQADIDPIRSNIDDIANIQTVQDEIAGGTQDQQATPGPAVNPTAARWALNRSDDDLAGVASNPNAGAWFRQVASDELARRQSQQQSPQQRMDDAATAFGAVTPEQARMEAQALAQRRADTEAAFRSMPAPSVDDIGNAATVDDAIAAAASVVNAPAVQAAPVESDATADAPVATQQNTLTPTEALQRQSDIASSDAEITRNRSEQTRSARMAMLDTVLNDAGIIGIKSKLARFAGDLQRTYGGTVTNPTITEEEWTRARRHSNATIGLNELDNVQPEPMAPTLGTPNTMPADLVREKVAPVAQQTATANPLPEQYHELARASKTVEQFWKGLNALKVPLSGRGPLTAGYKAFRKAQPASEVTPTQATSTLINVPSTQNTAPANAAKEPWQMTRAEWDMEREAIRPNNAQSNFTKASGSQAVASAGRLQTLLHGVSDAAGQRLQDAQDGKITLSQEEAEALLDRVNAPVTHQDVIDKAIAEGSPVPAEVRAEYATATNIKPPAPAANPKTRGDQMRANLKAADSFLSLLATEGVSTLDRADIGLDRGNIGNRLVPGHGPVVRKNGLRLDLLALRAFEDGHLTQSDMDYDGGVSKLSDMIKRAIAGKEVIRPDTNAMDATQRNDDALMQEAASLDIETAGKTADQVYDEVVMHHAGQLEEVADDIQFDMDATRVTVNHLSDEEVDALFGIGKAAENGASTQESAGTVSRSGDHGSAAQAESFSLQSETASESTARVNQQEQQQAATQAANVAADNKAQADAEVGSFTLTGSDRKADIGAAQGQGDIFAQAQQAESILDAANITGSERIAALKDVKKGEITVDELARAHPARAINTDMTNSDDVFGSIGERSADDNTQRKPTEDQSRAYSDAIASGKRRMALRALHEAMDVPVDVDASVDRDGAHSPSGPEDGSPMYDVSKNGTYPEDIYSHNGLRYYGTGEDAMDRQAYDAIKSYEAHPNRSIAIYRAVYKDESSKIEPGAWVTTVRQYAKDHGENTLNGDYKIIKKLVSARDIFTSGDSWLEWGYHPQQFKPELPKGERKSISLTERMEGIQSNESTTPLSGAIGEGLPDRGSAFDQSLHADIAAGTDAKSILTRIVNESTNANNRAIAQQLLDHGVTASIEIGSSAGQQFQSDRPQADFVASYSPKKNLVTLFQAAGAEQNLIHEFVHSLVTNALKKGGIAALRMKALYAEVGRDGSLSGQYGMESIDEFVAEAHSNPVFQSKLEAIKLKEGSAWKRFVNIVRSILGMKPADANMLDAVLRTGRELMGENGETAISDDSILGNVRAGTWNAPAPSMLDNFIYRIQNKHIDLKQVQQAINTTSGQIKDTINAYLKEELFHGRSATRIDAFLNDELTPLISAMRIGGVTQEEIGQYLWAQHAKEANAHIAKINPDEPDLQDGGSGMTNKESADYLAALTPEKRAKYAALAKRVYAITKATRQQSVDYGLMSQADRDTWEAAYQFYVPLQREDMDTMAHGAGSGQGYSIRGSESKRRTGSTRAVVDIIGNIANARDKTVVRGEKNRVGLALFGLAQENPNLDFWKVDKPPVLRVVETIGGVDQVVERIDPLYKSKDNVVMVKIANPSNGKVEEHAILFNERNPRAVRMAAAIKNLDGSQLGELLSAAAKVTRYFSAINTQYNPIFGVVNLVRDTQGAMLNLTDTPIAGKQGKILSDVARILAGAVKHGMRDFDGQWKTLSEEYAMAGGKTGYKDMYAVGVDRSEAIQKALDPDWWTKTKWGKTLTANGYLESPMAMMVDKGARPVLDWLSSYNEVMENTVRLAAYKEAKASGMSIEQAASLAKNLTVNFNRKGEMATQAGALYAFFNAAVQGQARMITALKGPAGRRIIGGGILLGAMQSLLLVAAGFGDDEPPEFVRERNLILPIGNHKYLTLPMPLGFNVLPNIGRLSMELLLSGGDGVAHKIESLLSTIVDATNPLGGSAPIAQIISPTITDPIVALSMNKDWTGKPISREDFNSLNPTPGFTRSKDVSSMPAKWVAEAINALTGGTKYKPGIASPTADQIEYLVGQVTGGVGREAGKITTTVETMFTGEELPEYKMPLVGRFYGATDGQSSQGNAFYNNLRKMNAHEATVKGLRLDHKGGEAMEYLRDNPDARLFQFANMAERRVGKLRQMKRKLIESGASKERIKIIELRITSEMARLNRRADRLQEAD